MALPHVGPYADFFSLNSKLDADQKTVIESVRKFMTDVVKPKVPDMFESGNFDRGLIKEIGEQGLFGANLTGYDLPGLDSISYGYMMKETERVDSGIRSLVSVQGALCMYPIHAFGSEEQKQKWLQPMHRGEKIGCFCLTEPDGGSDPGSMKTRATDEGDHYLLNGSKMWITNGSLADVAIVWAKLDGTVRGFLVPTDLDGVHVSDIHKKMSLRASVTSSLTFEDVKLPKSAILEKTTGLKQALMCLNQARFGISWGVIGAAEACYDEVRNFCSDRILFGKPLHSFQLIQKKMADCLRDITLAQMMALRLSELKMAGELHPAHISMAKQNNVEMALNVARKCRDMLGANGISLEYETMRHMCNLESVYTYEGTNDIHSLVVGTTITGVQAFG